MIAQPQVRGEQVRRHRGEPCYAASQPAYPRTGTQRFGCEPYRAATSSARALAAMRGAT